MAFTVVSFRIPDTWIRWIRSKAELSEYVRKALRKQITEDLKREGKKLDELEQDD